MPDQAKTRVIDGLKDVMDRRGVRLSALAELSGVPYRSLQNYFSRKTEMPVSVYLKICQSLDIDGFYVDKARFELNTDALRSALRAALGELLPRPEFTGEGAMILVANGDRTRSERELNRDASTLAMFVRGHYDIAREAKLDEPLDDAAPELSQ